MDSGLDPKLFAEARRNARTSRIRLIRRRVVAGTATAFALFSGLLGYHDLRSASGASASSVTSATRTASQSGGQSGGTATVTPDPASVAPVVTAPAPAPAPLVTQQS